MTLRKGDTGSAVRDLQRKLNKGANGMPVAVVFDLDLGAIRSAAKTHVTTPGYVATVATVATA